MIHILLILKYLLRIRNEHDVEECAVIGNCVLRFTQEVLFEYWKMFLCIIINCSQVSHISWWTNFSPVYWVSFWNRWAHNSYCSTNTCEKSKCEVDHKKKKMKAYQSQLSLLTSLWLLVFQKEAYLRFLRMNFKLYWDVKVAQTGNNHQWCYSCQKEHGHIKGALNGR